MVKTKGDEFIFFALFHLLLSASLHSPFTSAAVAAETPDWGADKEIPLTGRPNPYGWDQKTLGEKVRKGQLHALHYPVEVTGLVMPARSSLKILDMEPGDPLFGMLKIALNLEAGIKNFKGFWKWLGLNDYPETETSAEYPIPFDKGVRPKYPMGVTIADWKIGGKSQVLTLSCAACHTATLFGKPVLGLSNRFPGANAFFKYAQNTFHKMPSALYRAITFANKDELRLYKLAKNHIRSVGLKVPRVRGMDASLAQVALSLAKREVSPWAERSRELEEHPRADWHDDHSAESKPMVWWNTKYKNRWLADGSILSGNPIFTNLLWNEIGRGVDLHELAEWLETRTDVIEELTTAIFATKAPHWASYLPVTAINIERARRGETVFAQNCAKCHGEYRKDWSRGIETVEVRYHTRTPVVDVGTDPVRRQGMQSLGESLNRLAISKQHDIVVAEQQGYVPPPLDGIFARYPYLHNNSIPSLCALMTPPESRPRVYYAGEPIVPGRDFDLDCVGYPTADHVPAEWKKDPLYTYDTTLEGQGNAGHYDKIFRTNGVERYNADQKRDLIEYLKTL
ncbi:MAG: cytochrome c [Bdellovibrionales bacterium]|nr:cytochrome c [Bdellovibrionales bacterium]